MQFPKYITYLLIAILIIGIACLYFAFVNKKDTNAQSDLLLAMADNLSGKKGNQQSAVSKEQPQPEEDKEEIEEDNNTTVEVADKLYFKKPLTIFETKYAQAFKPEVDQEFAFANNFYPLCDKFAAGITEFSDEEKSFYEENTELVDNYVNDLKSKMAASQSTNPPVSQSTNLSKANPPMTAEERTKIILSLFEDNVPKTVSEISSLYAAKANRSDSRGTMYGYLTKLEQAGIVLQQKIATKVYYGIPEWFDGKKLKPEYKKKI